MILRLLCLVLAALVCRSMAADAAVQDVMLLPQGQGVRIVVELGKAVPFAHLTLAGPPRLAIDLPEMSWVVPPHRSERSFRMVERVRFGRFKTGVSRIVVDTNKPFQVVRVFELPSQDHAGYRIVTDLAPLNPGESMAQQRRQSRTTPPPVTPPRPVLSDQERDTDPEWQSPPVARPAGFPAPLPRLKPSFLVRQRIIVIDPGHGGIDPGAVGGRIYEKDVVLMVARELRRQLLATGRYDVVLTRDDDSFVRLRDRLQIARSSKGDLFLSLHADSLVGSPEVQGAAVYTLSERASSDEAGRLATAENRADILGGIDLSRHEPLVSQILIDLAQRDANTKSLRAAEFLVEELDNVTKMLRKERQQAGFVVLKSPDVPSALVELGYLSNRDDEQRLSDPAHVADLARAMIQAIDRYFGQEQS